jgi:isoleucyl-tRNA synthetase
VLRLWVASGDYQTDIRISKDILKQTAENYKKIRNTARFILGVLSDFTPEMAVKDFTLLDCYSLSRLNLLIQKVTTAYEQFDYHVVSYAVHNFCVVEMSNFYLDVLKDRLYCEKRDSHIRRSAQTVLHTVLTVLTKLITPILCYTAEEIWQHLPRESGNPEMALFGDMPVCNRDWEINANQTREWEALLIKRDEVNKALETARTAGTIGKSLEAAVTIRCGGSRFELLDRWRANLPELFIVSEVKLIQDSDGIDVTLSENEKCLRCWNQRESVGQSKEHPQLCARCVAVVSA